MTIRHYSIAKLSTFLLVILLTGCGGGSENEISVSNAPAPVTDTPSTPVTETPDTPVTETPVVNTSLSQSEIDRDVVRFLTQSTFGASEASYNALREKIDINGANRLSVYETWIDNQLDMPETNMQDLMDGVLENTNLDSKTRFERQYTFWTLAVNSPDQLRHRLAQSLSEILVISDQVNSIFNAYRGLTNYWDLLASSGNHSYKDLLGDVTRHTSMGVYLSSLQNQKANPDEGIFPDENYAREVMQLFTFGLVHLNQDGSSVLDESNQEIPTYDNTVITEVARVFTGLSHSYRYSNDTTIINETFFSHVRNASGNQVQWTSPMKFFPDHHDFGQKTLFTDKGVQLVLPARTSTQEQADQELDTVISALVSHSSTAPRISRLLIQQLVTSNPSPAYIERVATAFGQDGDIRTTLKAILLDPEARDPKVIENDTFGKQKSPLLHMTSLLRLTGVKSEFYLDGRNHNLTFTNADRFENDAAFLRIQGFSSPHKNLTASSVFNFYSPNYSPSGDFTDRGLVSPESELLVETAQIDRINDIFLLLRDGTVNRGARLDAYSLSEEQQRVWLNYDRATEVWNNTEGNDEAKASALVDYLDFYYNASQIKLSNEVTGTRDVIIEAIVNSPNDERISIALYGVANAPESMIQK